MGHFRSDTGYLHQSSGSGLKCEFYLFANGKKECEKLDKCYLRNKNLFYDTQDGLYLSLKKNWITIDVVI